ncbi:MAG: hypothetical protein WBF45_04985 [Acidobacteriaceae bacterium]
MSTRGYNPILLAGILLLATSTAMAQFGSPACVAAQKAVSEQQAKINTFEQSKNDSQYLGQGQIVYTTTLKEMQDELAGLRAGEQIECAAIGGIQDGQILPRYQILTIIYAPPGTAGGKSSSYVDYSTGSTLGTTIDVSNSFKKDFSITAGLSVGGGGNSASVSLDNDWSVQQTTTDDYKVTSSGKNEVKVPGPATDGIDHNYDEIWLCLNPLIQVQIAGTKLTYTPGINGTPMQQIYVYVSELKNPSSMRADVAATLKAKGFTAADYAAILAADPFANGSGSIDTRRFQETSTTFPYEPPPTAQDMPTITSYSLTNDSTSTVTMNNGTGYTITLSASVSAGFGGIASATVSTKDSWAWTQTNSTANSSGTTSSATVAVADPSYGYAGDVAQVAVYWDTLFNSFMFSAIPTGNPFATGILYDHNHMPIIGQKVVLTVPGHIFQTYTDKKGVYRFVGFAPITAMSGVLTAGSTKETVSITPTRLTRDLNIQ